MQNRKYELKYFSSNDLSCSAHSFCSSILTVQINFVCLHISCCIHYNNQSIIACFRQISLKLRNYNLSNLYFVIKQKTVKSLFTVKFMNFMNYYKMKEISQSMFSTPFSVKLGNNSHNYFELLVFNLEENKL